MLFKGKWYNIKQLIGIVKEAKLKNSVPIKYHIEVSAKYWEGIFRAEGITDRRNIRGELSDTDKPLVQAVKSQIVAYLRDGSFSARRWQDIVNYIRQRHEAYPEWHNSATAQLFSPPVFKNKKNAAGYFFQLVSVF